MGIVGSLLAPAGLAMLVLLLGTVMHQTVIQGFPFGLLLSGLLLLGVEIPLRRNRKKAWMFGILFSVGIFVTALEGNQDAMIPANSLGYLWSYGSIALALLVAMFPKLK